MSSPWSGLVSSSLSSLTVRSTVREVLCLLAGRTPTLMVLTGEKVGLYLRGLVLSLDLAEPGGVEADDDSAVDDFLLGLAELSDPEASLAAAELELDEGPATAGTGSGRLGGLTPGNARG